MSYAGFAVLAVAPPGAAVVDASAGAAAASLPRVLANAGFAMRKREEMLDGMPAAAAACREAMLTVVSLPAAGASVAGAASAPWSSEDWDSAGEYLRFTLRLFLPRLGFSSARSFQLKTLGGAISTAAAKGRECGNRHVSMSARPERVVWSFDMVQH